MINLTKMKNIKTNDLNLNTSEFDDIKSFVIKKDKNIPPIIDIVLSNSIDSMLNRWGVPKSIERDEIKILSAKLYYGRFEDSKTRIFWRVLKENINNIYSSE